MADVRVHAAGDRAGDGRGDDHEEGDRYDSARPERSDRLCPQVLGRCLHADREINVLKFECR